MVGLISEERPEFGGLVRTVSMCLEMGAYEALRVGLVRARKLSKQRTRNGYTVASGLATGIDTVSHEAAIEAGGQTVAVIGTPLSTAYPKENETLQRRIAEEYLLISQVPVGRYEKQDFRRNRAFLPERNAAMSALSVETAIVEAGGDVGSAHSGAAGTAAGAQIVHPGQLLSSGAQVAREASGAGASPGEGVWRHPREPPPLRDRG